MTVDRDAADPGVQAGESPDTPGRRGRVGDGLGRGRRRSRGIGLALLASLTALVVAGCAEDKPLNTFEPRGPKAEQIDSLMMPIWGIMGVVFVLVIGGTIWLALRNRVNPDTYDPDDLPAQTHGNFRLEIAWTIAPALVLALISIPVVANIWSLEKKGDGVEVMVIGQQWWWEYRYDVDGDGFFVDANGDGVVDEADQELPLNIALDRDDVVTANELVIPAGEQVDLVLTSRDVIHSFWIPRLNGKRDTVPGRWHTWALQADEPGKFTGWCTEFCGMSHARMRMSTIALPRADFDQWLANQATPAEVPTETEAAAGYELFQNQCMSCHVINDGNLDYGENFEAALTAGGAPNLTHFATRTVFAGATLPVYLGPGTDPNDDAFNVENYLDLSALAADADSPDDYRLNRPLLKQWVSDASQLKDMSPDDGRGMLPFPQLTDEQLNQIVAYLATLD
ncbi:MAG: cytochrome c oxidase subunit II [Acidimicrobiales bacterium]